MSAALVQPALMGLFKGSEEIVSHKYECKEAATRSNEGGK